jgi:hypothetical protein
MTIAFNLSQLANYVNTSGKLDAANGFVNATPVANGGTGAATATAYAVQCGGTTSTGAHQSIASVGTTGQILTSNGAGALPSFQTAPSSGFSNMSVFTSSGTWTVPAGVTKCKVTVVGGGGGSPDPANYSFTNSAGGGAGGAAIKICSITPGVNITITVGSGGTGGYPVSGGGTSSFGSFCSASGGAYGGLGYYSSAGGLGGIGSSGDLNIRGGNGGGGWNIPDTFDFRGGGGSSILGGGGADSSGGTLNGGQYGGGGGASAGSGASGVVIIEY